MEQKQEKFSTIGYIAAALGMCIGTGNVWRFPRVCAANGGGAFIIAWTIAIFGICSTAPFHRDGIR